MAVPDPFSILQILLFLIVLVACVRPLGMFMALVYEGRPPRPLGRLLGPVERLIYRVAGVDPAAESGWGRYAAGLLMFNLIGLLAVYGLQRTQATLPLNPAAMAKVSPDSSLNTAVSFASNTNWQGYGGEGTMSYLTQMLGLGVQNFASAATGMAVLIALCRGLSRRGASTIGNVWVDLTRSTLYILLPLSLVLAVFLVGQGVVQTFEPYREVTTPSGTTQTIALGPAASQVAIKQLGTNGGGFFNANSAHPLENPTPLSNFAECLSIVLIPAALCYTFGVLVGDRRQGWAVLAAMLVIFVPLVFVAAGAEQAGNPALGVAGANMEGKEQRFSVGESAVWAVATTAASNGSVNAMHDSFTPVGGMVPMCLMQLGEVVLGGVGSGLYGMLVFAIVAVFVSGLMVGRTPEFLGKKIEAFEMKMATLVLLVPCACVLIGAAVAVTSSGGLFNADGTARLSNPGPHGFSQILYWASSVGNNNGSAFAGLSTSNVFYNVAGAVLMFASRFGVIVAVLAIAGSLARKPVAPVGPGTLATHTPLFVTLLVGVVLLVGALTFVPALALGPIAEQLAK